MSKATEYPVSGTDVRDEILAISHSSLFAHSRRSIELLKYLCNMVLLGRQDEIKESTIALEVFDRTSEFDDKKDAIVRVEAHRLRHKLATYYAAEGSHDRVVIELSPGSYIPRFIEREPERPETPASALPALPLPRRRFDSRLILTIGVTALLAFILGTSLGPSRGGTASGRPLPRTSAPPARAIGAPPPATAGVRILAGNPQPYIDRAGRRWSADRYFQGGAAQPGPSEFLGRPPDPSLYRFMRYGDFSYDIPVPAGAYELWLHFAEPSFRTGNDVGNDGGENQRHFTVTVNGASLLHDFDVVNDSGVSPVDVRVFRDITPAADGYVHLRFQTVLGSPFVNAIELVPGTPGHLLPIRIRAGDSSFTDHNGNVWNPDDYYIGGRLATHKGDVSGTPDPDLYAGERYGNFIYSIPVPPGRYSVTLYFAETYWDPASEPSRRGGAGSRVFNVSCNGAILLEGFDILNEAKPFQAVTHVFHNLQPNGQGKLLLSFSPVTNYAAIKAIEVTDESRAEPRP